MSGQQRTTEWLSEDIDYAYHERQFERPYQSTIDFCGWLTQLGALNPQKTRHVLDVGCGQGANLYYLRSRLPTAKLAGIDLNPKLVERGNALFAKSDLTQIQLRHGDLYNLTGSHDEAIDCLLSFQTLSWLPEFKAPLASFAKTGAEWICLSSLFYDGPITCTISVQEYDEAGNETQKSFCNIYSLEAVKNYLTALGYDEFHSTPFEISIDLPAPTHKGLGTYTQTMANGKRLQISGPLLMTWHFIAARRSSREKK